jgi:hypothetical protein
LAKEKRSAQPAMSRVKNKADMGKKAFFVLLVGLLLASGCVSSSGSRYRPCHELRTDISVSNDEFERHCPRGAPD